MGYGTTPDDVINNDEELIPSPPSSGLFYLNQGVDDDRFSFSSPYYASSSPRTTDPEVSAELDCYDSLETTAIVDVSYRKNRVTWRAANGEARQMFDLSLDLYANTETNTSIFKLYTYIIRKGRKGRSNKQAVYLFIHPENVRFITCEPSRTARRYKSKTNKPQTYYELRFSLTECPNIVVPRDRAFESKDKTRAQLDLFQELSSTNDFVVHLNGAGINASKLDDLRLLGCMFSPTFTEHRPTTDFRRASLATLYAGSGGEIVCMNRGVVQSIEVDPPPYVGPAPDSCMVSSEYLCSDSEDGYDDDDDEESEEDEEEKDKNAFANHVLLLLDNLQTHFNAVERYFDGMERRLHGLENCVQQRRHEITFALAMANRHYNNMNNVNSNSNSSGSHSGNSTAQSPYPPYQTTVAQNTPATQRDEMVPQGV
ncbi:hypothetical protein TRIATDRAFT_300963 [Trichoderma atroviride IMI 206040]|uniref:Uncharacterized protein n=1 Tax=Hypocrea atroviridis (strain ATCC 20476 / IMI 206040) TaxID=452589 RepID=G9P3L6_HYPAI|nr:uncharacterized protein TRIATDRAFT_300963 [Trichoderma atroviride IMI 206040]EHK42974.1 hypothetical protein TRIATDRAFT_300963 [Trichoderma atroviride IMI 206040]